MAFFELKQRIAAQILVALPRRRSLCHSSALYDFLALSMLTRTRDALVECIESTRPGIAVVRGVPSAPPPSSDSVESKRQMQARRVSLVAASLNTPRLSPQDFYLLFDVPATLHFIELALDELAEMVASDAPAGEPLDAKAIEEAWEELVQTTIEHFSKRRRLEYRWVVLGASIVVDTPATRTVLTVLPADLVGILEVAFCSGLNDVSGKDWHASLFTNSDANKMTIAMRAPGAASTAAPTVFLLGRGCSCERISSLQASPVSASLGATNAASPTPAVSMSLKSPSTDQAVRWFTVPWEARGALSMQDLHALDPVIESILETTLAWWQDRGCVDDVHYCAYGDIGTWTVYQSATELWELELCRSDPCPSSLGEVPPCRMRCRVVRQTLSPSGHFDEADVVTEAALNGEGQPLSLPPRVQQAVNLYLSMAHGAFEDFSVLHYDHDTLSTAASRYDSPFLEADVLRLVVPLLLDPDNIVPLGRSDPACDPSVASVVRALDLPVIDPKRFIWSSEVFYEDDHGSTNLRAFAESYEFYLDGHWLPLSPVNEWLMAKGYGKLFVCGAWYLILNDVAVPAASHSAAPFAVDSDCLQDDGVNVMWLRRKGENPVRLVCRGVPMSLDRRVLLESRCPAALLRSDVVLVDSMLDPSAVQRAWKCGDRGNLRVLEFFAFDGMKKNTPALPGTQRLVTNAAGAASLYAFDKDVATTRKTHAETAEILARRKQAVANMLSSCPAGKYQFKFPVLPTAL